MIISGGSSYNYSIGNSAEVYVPSTGHHCQLPDIPGHERLGHTMEKMMICGGYMVRDCLTLTDDGTWEKTTASTLEWR